MDSSEQEDSGSEDSSRLSSANPSLTAAKENIATVFDLLPEDILLKILSRTRAEDKLLSLPLVCKSWHEALNSPSRVWRSIDLLSNKLGWHEGQKCDARRLGEFLQVRAARVERLTIARVPPKFLSMQEVSTFIGPGIVAMAGRLRRLELWCDVPYQLLAGFGACLKLESLHLRTVKWAEEGVSKENCDVCITEVLEPLTTLTKLHRLYLVVEDSFLKGPLPAGVTAMTKLRKLCLGNAALSSLNGIGTLQQLTRISLQNFCNDHFPVELCSLTSLEKLRLFVKSKAKSFVLPESVSRLARLSKLDMFNAQLMNPLSAVTKLTSLTLSHCGLPVSWPDYVSTLIGLEELSVSRNNVQEIPDTISCLTNLTRLSVRNKDDLRAVRVPSSITALQHLQSLQLDVYRAYADYHACAVCKIRLSNGQFLDCKVPSHKLWKHEVLGLNAALYLEFQQAAAFLDRVVKPVSVT